MSHIEQMREALEKIENLSGGDAWEYRAIALDALAKTEAVNQHANGGGPTKTTGHCEHKRQLGGCQLHNLHCGYPKCDERASIDADEPQATPIPCAVRVGVHEFKAGTPFCDVIDKALTDLDIARALLIRAASSLDDTGNTDNALLLKQIDRFLMDKWNDSEAA